MDNYIEVKKFGPIDKGFGDLMPIYPITIFIGKQGAGKSTVAKLISTFLWMEKALIRGDISLNKKRLAYLVNKKHPFFHASHKQKMNEFHSQTHFRLLIQRLIEVK